ncbi:hypothetical protein [Poseidonocella sp. HB161398]|uniref:hypothetical protein n=1 Tax=Poseidonocella sp. HB161398 TaxID=2320855 RepID=UPI001107F28F|nr:hypothetical protein [Poseidonocella sp. HB161398]
MRRPGATGTARLPRPGPPAAGLALAVLAAHPAGAHEAGGGFILLMPTGVWTFGAALAVAATFLALAFAPDRWFAAKAPVPETAAAPRFGAADLLSLCSAAFTGFLLYAALAGKDDPLSNPAPLAVWTLGWILMTPACALFGNLWRGLNPWTGLLRLCGLGARPLLRLPARAGFSIAVLQLGYLVWIDLVSLHATDPEHLFAALLWFLALNGAGMAVFGIADWTRRAEPLHVAFRLLSALAPVGIAHGRPVFRLPGAAATERPPLAPGEVLFILVLLASGTFDGLSSTFRWLGLIGANPLEFHGRSQVMLPNSTGLAAAVACLAAVFLGALALGNWLARTRAPLAELAGRCAWSLLPIYVAYMLSHFATRLVMDLQYLWKTASDPLGRGWDLFGTAGHAASASLFSTSSGVALIWSLQVAAITAGHVAAVLMAHAAALRCYGSGRDARAAQLPLAAMMVGYTWLGLALLAAPRI